MLYEVVFKFNPYHGKHGRFASRNEASFISTGPKFQKTIARLREAKPWKPINGDARFSGDGVAAHKFSLANAKYLKSLPEEIQKGITEYTQTSYRQINEYLRGQRETLLPANKKSMEAMLKVTDRPLGADFMVHRGLQNEAVRKAVESMKPGDAFVEKGFMSTSEDKRMISEFVNTDRSDSVVMAIRVRSTDKGVVPGKLSAHLAEREIILHPNTKLVFSHKEEDKNGEVTYWFDTAGTSSPKRKPVKKADFSLVLKFNPYHGKHGRFASRNEANFVSIGPRFQKTIARLRNESTPKTVGKVDYSVVPKNIAEILDKAGDSAYQRVAAANANDFADKYPGESYSWVDNNEIDMQKTAAHLNMTPEEFKAQLQTSLNEYTKNASVYMNMSEGTLSKVLSDGEFKNQYATNSSGGYLSPGKRQRFEEHFFGLQGRENYGKLVEEGGPKVVKRTVNGRKMEVEEGHLSPEEAKKFPVYGYLSEAKDGETNMVMYGNVRVKFKSDVKERTTFTGEDSLDMMKDSEIEQTGKNAGKVGPTHTGLARIVASPVNDPSIRSLYPLHSKERTKPADYVAKTASYSYNEAQIWGGLKSSSIDTVYFSAEPSKSLQTKLKKLKIKYEVKPRKPKE
jgi:hypothetical protein